MRRCYIEDDLPYEDDPSGSNATKLNVVLSPTIGQEPEGIICLQTDKQFLEFHFVIEQNNNKFSKDSCL